MAKKLILRIIFSWVALATHYQVFSQTSNEKRDSLSKIGYYTDSPNYWIVNNFIFSTRSFRFLNLNRKEMSGKKVLTEEEVKNRFSITLKSGANQITTRKQFIINDKIILLNKDSVRIVDDNKIITIFNITGDELLKKYSINNKSGGIVIKTRDTN